jgi:hypothetical protein
MREVRSIPAALPFLVLCGCASSGAGEAADKPGAALEALVKRELPGPLPRAGVAVFKGQMTGEIEASGAIKTDEGKLGDDGEAAELKVPLGAAGELECLIYPEAIPAGGTISKILTEVSKEVHFERVRLVDVKVIESSPAAYLEADYSAPDSAGGKVFGQFKMMLYASPDNPILCMHDEVGFRASFRRISEGLFRSLRLANADPAPRYTEVHVARLGQVPIGFEYTSLVDGKEDRSIISIDGALFFPKGPGAFTYADHSITEVADSGGNTVIGVYSDVKDGQVQSSVRVDRTGEGQYAFKGERRGKPVEGTFRSRGKRGLISSLAVMDEVRNTLLSGKAADLTVEEYHPDADPARTVDVVYKHKEGRTVTSLVDGVEMSTVRDERGRIEKGALGAGAQQISVERVFVHGTP